MMFIAIKTEDGAIKGKLSFYCRMLGVSRQGFYKYLAHKDRPWKYQDLADAIRAIHTEDEYNDTYGRIRMYQALLLKKPEGLKIPSERTVYRDMDEIGLSHRPKRKSNGITRTDWEARKLDDLLRRDFKSNKPLEKCVTGITEIKAKDGKLYVSAIFDCFDSSVLGLAMETNMKATTIEELKVLIWRYFISYWINRRICSANGCSSNNQETEILPISGTGCIGSDILEVNLSTNIDNIIHIPFSFW